jgi:hypothetical protein
MIKPRPAEPGVCPKKPPLARYVRVWRDENGY